MINLAEINVIILSLMADYIIEDITLPFILHVLRAVSHQYSINTDFNFQWSGSSNTGLMN